MQMVLGKACEHKPNYILKIALITNLPVVEKDDYSLPAEECADPEQYRVLPIVAS